MLFANTAEGIVIPSTGGKLCMLIQYFVQFRAHVIYNYKDTRFTILVLFVSVSTQKGMLTLAVIYQPHSQLKKFFFFFQSAVKNPNWKL